MELERDSGTLYLYVNDVDGIEIDVQIVMNKVHIVENVGGGLRVFLLLPLAQSYTQLRMKNVKVVLNYLAQGNVKYIGYIVRFHVTNEGDLNASLDSVDIANNIFLFHTKNTWISNPFNIRSLSIINTEVHFK